MKGAIYPLHGQQKDAVDPLETVWLSASAGTGKTQVLSARVLRLLLQPDVEPSQILCLTFTKAGAAEMADRVNDVLARWVRMDDGSLARDLKNIGSDVRPETLSRARTLFARVLDCPGGGLRIDTIHAFAQWLLSAFPEEAGLTPGTRAMEDRDRDLLFRDVLAQFLSDAEAQGDTGVLSALDDLSLRKGPEEVEQWLMRCGSAHDLWTGPGGWQSPLGDRVRHLLGIAADAGEADLAELCGDDVFDVGALRRCMEINQAWSAKTGKVNADKIAAWLAGIPVDRAAAIGDLYSVFHTAKGDLRAWSSQEKIDPAYPDHVREVATSIERFLELRRLLDLAEWLTPALELGRKFALVWDEAKAREGFIDFDDQIRRASQLLTNSDLSDWIRYKLDRHFDHILVDEAQDTNEAQWRIILDGLTSEFFSGFGQRDGRTRTLFVVGDYKQAIFRFQGTSPENFRHAQKRVHDEMERAARNAAESRGQAARRLQEPGLNRSFRTGQPVLDFVDQVIAAIGPAQFGLDRPPEPHEGDDRPGLVTMWPPVSALPDEDDESEDEVPEEGEQSWLPRSDRVLADKIALQVKSWLTEGFPLVKGTHRNATAGDIMVLVRQRKELAALIVARLHARGVPVAGVDRLRLGGPLAVQDLMAALRFAAQPLDDLNLASLLVSPLIGWNQEELLEHGWRKKGRRLWDHLRASSDSFVRTTLARLMELLALADFEPPHALLHWLLVGPWHGRKRLVARLGVEANDPIDELLNAALNFAGSHTPSLQGFIQWFDAGEGELKRDAGTVSDQVRVMTVHGSKGLQSPIVILADAAGNPDNSRQRDLELAEITADGSEGRKVPLPGLPKDQRAGRISEAAEQAAREEREEHWRLLYVAMTRAEEALFIGGSLNLKDKGIPAPDSWYARLKPLFSDEPVPDAIWNVRWEAGMKAPLVVQPASREVERAPALPNWALNPAEREPRPPRPLAPSAAGVEMAPSPPLPSDAGFEAARRGTLIHALLERLPELQAELRADAARRWLAKQTGDVAEEKREEILASALRVLETPDWAEIFAPDALAEVPLAATVGGRVIAGTADRLLVTKERVLVVDFKSAARPPSALDEIPLATLRQMAAYSAALEAIYPGRRVEAALLYTQTPQLFALPETLLAEHKTALALAE